MSMPWRVIDIGFSHGGQAATRPIAEHDAGKPELHFREGSVIVGKQAPALVQWCLPPDATDENTCSRPCWTCDGDLLQCAWCRNHYCAYHFGQHGRERYLPRDWWNATIQRYETQLQEILAGKRKRLYRVDPPLVV